MSNCDGWPSYDVDVEHLPDRRMRLWLHRGPSRVDLGTIDKVGGCYPLIEARVAAYLGPWIEDFYVELHIPRLDYVHVGDRVIVTEDEGRRTEGIVRDCRLRAPAC